MFRTERSPGADSGVRTIDASRECLYFVLERLFHPQVICAAPGGVCPRIEDTIRLVSRNLEREERLMTEFGYPELRAHHWEHQALLRRLERMKKTLVCGGYDNALVFDFLSEWADSHAAAFDKPFGEFLRQRKTEPVQKRGF